MTYRVILPEKIAAGKKLPVLYLLHGGGGGFHDWSNYSDVAQFAARGVILVMPEGASSYYMNAAEHPQDRYEDFVTRDLIADVERRFPAVVDRAHRAIAGVSMGGFGAVTLALKHPELYSFVGGISSALDVPSRPFSWRRIRQWRGHKAIFGEWGASTASRMIHLCSRGELIRRRLPISFSPAATRKFAACQPHFRGNIEAARLRF